MDFVKYNGIPVAVVSSTTFLTAKMSLSCYRNMKRTHSPFGFLLTIPVAVVGIYASKFATRRATTFSDDLFFSSSASDMWNWHRERDFFEYMQKSNGTSKLRKMIGIPSNQRRWDYLVKNYHKAKIIQAEHAEDTWERLFRSMKKN